jgi:WD40 repeat protein
VSTADLAVESLTLSPDGRLFAVIARDALGDRWAENPRRVEVRDGMTGGVLGTGPYAYSERGPLLFSPDGRQLVGFKDMTLLVWSAPEPGEPRLVRNDTRKHFTALAYHPSGRHLFATSNDETVHVYDAATWERVGRFTWQIGRLKAVAVSQDGTLAAAGSDRGEIVIWDVDV